MNKILLGLIFSLTSLIYQAQTELDSLEMMQQALDELQIALGQEDSVNKRLIDDELLSLQKLKSDNDSLVFELEILKTELMIAQGKLAMCNTSNLELNEEIYYFKNGNNLDLVETGYYVIIGSERTEKDANKLLEKLQKQTDQKIFVAQNNTKSWFHLCINQKLNASNVGKQVYKERKKGFSDAWYMKLN